MKIEQQIKDWLEKGVISADQAKQMLLDTGEKGKKEQSDKTIVAISTIGALLLGIGAILLVASNWSEMSDLLKVSVLAISTFSAYFGGYYLKYQKKNLPKVGAALFFLGALLFGASIFLIAQIYNVNANNHVLLLIWLAGILPLVYVFSSEPITVLTLLVFYFWVGFFVFRDEQASESFITVFPLIFFSTSSLLFAIGGLHRLKNSLARIGEIIKIISIRVALFCLFLLSFDFFSSPYVGYGDKFNFWFTYENSLWSFVFVSIAAIALLLIDMFLNRKKGKLNYSINIIPIILIAFSGFVVFIPFDIPLYPIIYNSIFALLCIFLIYMGYQKTNIKLVNMGIYWGALFIVAKYFDFFWKLLDKSIFFLVGGAILVGGGIFLENKRREIKKDFDKIKA